MTNEQLAQRARKIDYYKRIGWKPTFIKNNEGSLTSVWTKGKQVKTLDELKDPV